MGTGPAFANAGVVKLFASKHTFGDAINVADVGNGLDDGGEVLQGFLLVTVGQFNQAALLEGGEKATPGGLSIPKYLWNHTFTPCVMIE